MGAGADRHALRTQLDHDERTAQDKRYLQTRNNHDGTLITSTSGGSFLLPAADAESLLPAGWAARQAAAPFADIVAAELDGTFTKARQACASAAWTGPQTRSRIKTVLCDARISRVLTDSAGQVIGLEALTNEITTAQRRVLAFRDLGCVARSCTRPPAFCDAHHLLARKDGGTTDLGNLGPLCRRHHRIKQLGWTKTRTRQAAVRWTSPTGRSWTSPTPHSPAATPDRPPRRISPPPEDDGGDEHDWPDDPAGLELRADDTEPTDDHDWTAEQLQHTDTRWSLELDNPYLWEGSTDRT